MPSSPRRARRRGNPLPPSAREVSPSAGGRDGRTESSAPTIVYRTCALLLPCHSEPVTDVTGVGIRIPRLLPLPLGEVAERSEDGEGKQRRTAFRRFFQLVDKPSLWGQRFLYAGGARGGKARLESDQMSRKALPCKACVEHPKGTCFAARSDYFRAARRHKNNDIIFRLSKKAEGFFDSLKEPPSGGSFSLSKRFTASSPWG